MMRTLSIFAVALIVVAAIITLSGCRAETTELLDQPPAAPAVRTVTADERRISSVLTLDAVVVVNPFVRISAPSSGTLVTLTRGRVGIVPAGERRAVPVELPPDTEIVSLLVKPGTKVRKDLPIINARYTGFALQAIVAPELIYRLYDGVRSARAQVQPGPGPFEASVIGIPYPQGAIALPESPGPDGLAPVSSRTSQPRIVLCGGEPEYESEPPPAKASGETSTFPVVTAPPGDAATGLVVIASLPADVRVIEGLRGTLTVTTAEDTGVALPLEAVAGVVDRGQVYLVRDGEAVKVDVTLGITDGSYVRILSGLAVGDVVQIPSPSILQIVE